MARKIAKYLVLVIIIGLLAYNSVYIKKLSEVQAKEPVAFNATKFAEELWITKLPARLDSAVSLETLQTALKANSALAFDTYFNSLSIGNIRYAMVKITGKVLAVNEDEVTVLTGKDNPLTVKIATEYVYGNAIRDASKLVDIKDFVNTTDLNNISAALNKKVRTVVLPAFKGRVQKADSITCTGAIELNLGHYTLDELEIIPVQCKIVQP